MLTKLNEVSITIPEEETDDENYDQITADRQDLFCMKHKTNRKTSNIIL